MANGEQVSFIQMKDGTYEDYQILESYEPERKGDVAGALLDILGQMKGPLFGYKIDRYQHSLQTATRAKRDGAEDEMIVAALLHDIGDIIAPINHSQAAAAILRPYVSDRVYWIVAHHGIFQGYYFWHHVGLDRDARERYRGHPYFADCAAFCEDWDQNSFDPDYDTLPIDAFLPTVNSVLANPRESFG